MLTGYAMHKKVNELLTGAGLKPIPAQMIYNYCGKGYIRTVEKDGQALITTEEAARWATQYIEKKLAKANA